MQMTDEKTDSTAFDIDDGKYHCYDEIQAFLNAFNGMDHVLAYCGFKIKLVTEPTPDTTCSNPPMQERCSECQFRIDQGF